MMHKNLLMTKQLMVDVVRRCSSVVTSVDSGLGLISLNRPRALNSLNLEMIRSLSPLLSHWHRPDSGVRAVVISGAGGKAFCAGGDIRAITETPGGEMQKTFFREEYQLDHLVGELNIPYIAIMNGITMGGGVGISVNGRFRIATEKTVFAMPETSIGLVPDVGGGYFLPRLKGSLGMFLGLTGHRLKGWDCLKAGIATHAVSEDNIENVKQELINLTSSSQAVTNDSVENLLNSLTDIKAEEHVFSLEDNLEAINRIFALGSVEEIVENLKREDAAWASKAMKSLESASPTSLKVTYKQITEGRSLSSLADVLRMEQRLVLRCCEDSDFYEGVRATLIDRDNKPKWSPESLEKVTDDKVDYYFSNLGSLELQL